VVGQSKAKIPNDAAGFKISEVARQAGVGIETVRYYQRLKLLRTPERLGRGPRRYSSSDISMIRFIKTAQKLGFSLKETRGLLALHIKTAEPCRELRHKFAQKVQEIESQIRRLIEVKEYLEKLRDEECPCSGKNCRNFEQVINNLLSQE
jgi:DNA-binding transcriptional MerR regulator